MANAILIPFSGLVLLFAGFSCMGFAFSAVDAGNGITVTNNNAIVYYVFNGLGLICALLGAFPVQMRVRKRAVEMSLANACLACIFFLVAVIFGVIENYHAYNGVAVPNGAALYFLMWITAVCSMIANGALASFALIALYPPPSCPQEQPGVCPPLDDITITRETEMGAAGAAPRARSVPRSRNDLRRA